MFHIVDLQMICDRNQVISALGIILSELESSCIGINCRRFNEKGMTRCGLKFECCVSNNIGIIWGRESNHLVYANWKLRISNI